MVLARMHFAHVKFARPTHLLALYAKLKFARVTLARMLLVCSVSPTCSHCPVYYTTCSHCTGGGEKG